MKYPKYIIILLGLSIFFFHSCNEQSNSYKLNKYFAVENDKVFFINDNPANSTKMVVLNEANPKHFHLLTGTESILTKEESYIGADNMNVYYKNEILKGAEPTNFKILNDGFSKDNKLVFFRNIPLKKANAKHFTVLSNYYAKDNNNLWFCENVVSTGIDIPTFSVVDGYFSKDKNNVYINNQQKLIVFKDSEPATFSKRLTVKKNQDKDYFIYSSSNKTVVLNSKKEIGEPDFIFKINSESKNIIVLDENFFRDTASVFYKNTRLTGANPDSLKIIDNNYAKDSSYIFYKGKIIKENIPNTDFKELFKKKEEEQNK